MDTKLKKKMIDMWKDCKEFGKMEKESKKWK